MLLFQKPGEGSYTSLTSCDRGAGSDSPILCQSSAFFSIHVEWVIFWHHVDGEISRRVLLLLPWDWEQVKNLFIYRSWFNHIF